MKESSVWDITLDPRHLNESIVHSEFLQVDPIWSASPWAFHDICHCIKLLLFAINCEPKRHRSSDELDRGCRGRFAAV